MSGLSYNNKQMQHITLIDRLNASQAILWQLWNQGKQTESASAEFLEVKKAAYEQHYSLLKQVKKINKMNTPELPRVRPHGLKRKAVLVLS